MSTPSFLEDHISQIPAIQLLINLGYNYISPEEALALRGDKKSHVLLESIVRKQLKSIKIEDLLQRNKIELDSVNISGSVEGKTVLVLVLRLSQI